MKHTHSMSTRTLTHTAIFIAIITVLTYLVKIPFKPTQGYLTLADAGIYTAAYLLGPMLGGFAGGIGAGLADLISGYPAFVVLTFFAHGLQAVIAGIIGYKKGTLRMLLGCIAGTIVMTGIYYCGEVFLLDIAAGAAVLEIPGNICQNVAGILISIPLVRTLKKAYPQINSISGIIS